MKKLVVLLVLLFLTACTGRLTILKNDAGETQKCEVSASSEMLTGAWLSGKQHDKCIEKWKAAGFKPVE